MYGGYEDLTFTTDSDGNVQYGQTGTTTPTPTTPVTGGGGGGTKWWESVLGILPGLTTAIGGLFGQNNQQVTQPVYLPAATTNNNNNTLLIGGIGLIAILFFTMQKRK